MNDEAFATLTSQLIQTFVLVFFALVAIAIAWRRGSFRRSLWQDGPWRAVAILGRDVLAVVCLALLGMGLAGATLPFAQVQGELTTTQVALRVLWGQLGGVVFAFAYLAVLLARQRDGVDQFGLALPAKPWVGVAVRAWLLALPVVLACNSLTVLATILAGGDAPEFGHELFRYMGDLQSPGGMALLLVSVVVIAPMTEEILYRGVLQTWLTHLLGPSQRGEAMVLVAGAFSLVHLSAAPWQVLPALFVLGLMLGWLYETTGSLWPGIVVHALFNLVNVLAMLAMNALQAQQAQQVVAG